MRPIPIPDDLVPDWGERKVISPPDGDLLNEDIVPVEAIVSYDTEQDMYLFTMLIKIEDDDWETLGRSGGRFMLTMGGAVVPFNVSTLAVVEPEEQPAEEEQHDEPGEDDRGMG